MLLLTRPSLYVTAASDGTAAAIAVLYCHQLALPSRLTRPCTKVDIRGPVDCVAVERVAARLPRIAAAPLRSRRQRALNKLIGVGRGVIKLDGRVQRDRLLALPWWRAIGGGAGVAWHLPDSRRLFFPRRLHWLHYSGCTCHRLWLWRGRANLHRWPSIDQCRLGERTSDLLVLPDWAGSSMLESGIGICRLCRTLACINVCLSAVGHTI
jgi:hypothetical protein